MPVSPLDQHWTSSGRRSLAPAPEPEHQMAHDSHVSGYPMALQSLHAYDSDDGDELCQPQALILPADELQTQLDVRAVVNRLVGDVCNAMTALAVHSVVPDFRACVNDYEIDIDSSSSSSSSSWSLSSDEVAEETVFKAPQTKGELGLDQLPPIQRLDISAHVEELSHVGRVASILDRLVTVVSFKYLPPLDLESVLFSKDGQALGPIFDVFGPVKEPRYLLRFNSRQEIDDSGIAVDMPVYYAPNLPFTSYVFTSHLMAIRGSDASWKHDNEPPDGQKEYSDDEEERRDRNRNSRVKRKNFS